MAISSQDVVIDQQPVLIDGGNATAVKVDGSAVTQPVSGTVTANAGTGTFLVDGSAHTQPVSGTVTANAGTGTFLVDGSAHTQPVSGTVTANAGTGNFTVVQPTGTNLHTVVDSGTITTTQPTSSSSTVTQVTSTGANQTILASNASRKKAILFFESGIWYVKFGSTASASSKTYGINSNNTTVEVNIWVGQIDAFCTTAGKLVDVTELT